MDFEQVNSGCLILSAGPEVPHTQEEDSSSSEEDESNNLQKPILVKTSFYEWCCSYFAQSVTKSHDDSDPYSPQRIEREWRFLRNAKVRKHSTKQLQQYRK